MLDNTVKNTTKKRLGERLGFNSSLPFLSMSIASRGLRRRAGKRQGSWDEKAKNNPNPNPTTHSQEEQDEHLALCFPSCKDIALEIVASMAQHAMSFTNQMEFFLALTSYSHMTNHTL